MREIEWRIVDGAVAARPAPDRIEIQTHETWIYRADLPCGPNRVVRVERIVDYPAERYQMTAQGAGWRITRWSPGEGTIQKEWRCP